MDKQKQVPADIPKNRFIIIKPEIDLERLSFKALLERFYLLNTVPVSDGEA